MSTAWQMAAAVEGRAIAINAGDHTYTGGNEHGFPGHLLNAKGWEFMHHLCGMKLDWSKFDIKNQSWFVFPNGDTAVICTSKHDTGGLMRQKTGADLGAKYYLLLTQDGDSFKYRGYATHDELYGSFHKNWRGNDEVYALDQSQLHEGLPV